MLFKKSLVFFPIIAFFQLTIALSQNENPNQVILSTGDTIQVKALILSDINTQIEESNSKLSTIDKQFMDNSYLQKMDSIISERTSYFEKEEKATMEKLEDASNRSLEDIERKWKSHSSELKSQQKNLTDLTRELEKDNDFLLVMTKKWELTHKTISGQKGPGETLKRIEEEIAGIKGLKAKIKERLNQVSRIQNTITDLILLSDKVQVDLESKQMNWKSEYLKQNSSAIWAKPDTLANNETDGKKISFNLINNIHSIKEYFKDVTNLLYIHIFISILLLLSFYLFNNKLKIIEPSEEDKRMQDVRFFMGHFVFSAIIIATIASIWFYPDRPRPVSEMLIIILVIPSIYLYLKILSPELKKYMVQVMILFVLDEIYLFVNLNDSMMRLLLLVKSAITIWLLVQLINPRKPLHLKVHGKWWRFIYNAAYVFLLASLVSFIANILGFINLAMLLSQFVTYAILVGIMLSLSVGIAISFLIMIFQSKFMKGSNLVKNHQQLIEKRISLFLQLYALFLWFRSLLSSLGARNLFSNWVTSIMESSLKIGPVSISFGGFINFFIVIIVASLLAKIIKVVLEEELFPRIKLPRGVPGAISMVARYFIIGWGIYVALESAGIDLSTFGLLAGALGVGIGFGLQNIFANFISGLILAFERPIQTGDTIEVGTLMGNVKEIGVRASTIQTFDGSEVIVPNSNLITHEVTNWTLSDRKRRRDISVSVAYGTNPREVLAIIKKTANDHHSVIKNPGPWATFEGFGESSLNFKVRFWVSLDIGLTVKSEVAMSIYDAFEEAGIRIPFPQQDLHIKSFDPTVQKTIFPGITNKDEGKKKE